jgi:hypothetical protein
MEYFLSIQSAKGVAAAAVATIGSGSLRWWLP